MKSLMGKVIWVGSLLEALSEVFGSRQDLGE